MQRGSRTLQNHCQCEDQMSLSKTNLTATAGSAASAGAARAAGMKARIAARAVIESFMVIEWCWSDLTIGMYCEGVMFER